MNRRGFRWVALAGTVLAAGAAFGLALPEAPAQRYGELYARVQSAPLFEDSKTFADAEGKAPPSTILAAWKQDPPATDDALRAFVRAHFELPTHAETPTAAPTKRSLRDHIAALWPVLTRPPLPASANGSQLGFTRPHVVPGGRFREVYYWDTYFTALGLVRDGQDALVVDMTDGFADLVRAFGFVPNGTRTYYLSRSQPPFFYLLAGLTTPADPVAGQARVLAALRAEHAFWMAGEKGLAKGDASAHVVRLENGSVLNRYWDRLDTPRDESWREDVALAKSSGRPPAELYRELRAAAESGWDFSSRWFADGKSLATIETTAIVPVDLNALLFGLERAIADACNRAEDAACTGEFRDRSHRRREAMDRVLWSATCGCYHDFQWKTRTATGRLSAATLYPLFTGAASQDQGHKVADTVRKQLLAAGGVATTT
ncbi:MAG TPA: trehalase family glycosidase, partial [Nevskiaceae bacterium]|nr:trehalase family glycosidase [Nevskiaceae bacterium]